MIKWGLWAQGSGLQEDDHHGVHFRVIWMLGAPFVIVSGSGATARDMAPLRAQFKICKQLRSTNLLPASYSPSLTHVNIRTWPLKKKACDIRSWKDPTRQLKVYRFMKNFNE